jgi:hypothetical protein
MHAVHLPSRHLWQSAALAALLTLAFIALTLMAAGRLSIDGGPKGSSTPAQVSAPQVLAPAVQPADVSSWLQPLATPAPLLEASRSD